MLNLELIRHPWNWFVLAFWAAMLVLFFSAIHKPGGA